jgi:hypothetical protein
MLKGCMFEPMIVALSFNYIKWSFPELYFLLSNYYLITTYIRHCWNLFRDHNFLSSVITPTLQETIPNESFNVSSDSMLYYPIKDVV